MSAVAAEPEEDCRSEPVRLDFLGNPNEVRVLVEGERLSAIAIERCRPAGQAGAIFVDVAATEPYLFHVARISIIRAFDYQESELANARKRYTERTRDGERGAQAELDRIKQQQRNLAGRRASAFAQAKREVELIQAGPVEIIATVLAQPSQNPEDIAARDAEVERITMEIAMAFESSHGADVMDVSTPAHARLAGLVDYPGFDLYSKRIGQERGIEVKGRVGLDELELTENEWARACNLGDKYWLYAVFDCGSPNPRLLRVQNPFARLIAKARGSVVIGYRNIAQCATEGRNGCGNGP